MSSVVVSSGSRLPTQVPWFVIAVLAHVAVVAIASVLWFGHAPPPDDSMPLAISMRIEAPRDEFVPIEIVDRQPPPLRDQDLEPSRDRTEAEFTDQPDDPTERDAGVVTDFTTPSIDDLVNLSSSGALGGGTQIGLGAGNCGIVPSVRGGPPGGHGKYGDPSVRRKRSAGPQEDGAVEDGLRWLKDHQDEDGRWDADAFMKHDTVGEACTGAGNPTHDVGVTGLALLAFLGRGHTLKDGHYRHVVRKGVRWLVEQQDAAGGRIGEPTSNGSMYSHAIATLAICEACGLSEHRPLRPAVQSAVNFIVNARNPYGGWRYEPRSPDQDTSVTAWMVQALLSAKDFGFAVDDTALRAAAVWFDGVTDPATGVAGYTRSGEGSSRPVGKQERFPSAKTQALTAAVLLCRCLLEQDPAKTPAMALATKATLAMPPQWNENDGSIDMYSWYYATYALFQIGGAPWAQWSKKMSAVATKSQRRDGNAKGSWDPDDPWGDDGGRVYSTSLMVLCLQAPYRYGRVLGAR